VSTNAISVAHVGGFGEYGEYVIEEDTKMFNLSKIVISEICPVMHPKETTIRESRPKEVHQKFFFFSQFCDGRLCRPVGRTNYDIKYFIKL